MFTGEKVRLRAYRKEDLEKALQFINDPEVKRFLAPGIPFPLTESDEEKFISKQSGFNTDAYSFAIETLEGEYIGGCGINSTDWKNSVAVVGIFIGNKDYWGKGYGTDAMRVLLRFIFEQMNINKVKLFVYDFNKRAIRCYEKCGFKVEGVLRQEIYRDGRYHDELAMGILRSEWFGAGNKK
ncbi:GNAT family N-acetyltransferase [Thermosediminibacter oceani]|uniref:GCN5-related N-acetyltransferase n=1 Tax=Thermosediminibacter oceani (strain ATCC BAA-1034 / DSM 16646 / JW/IW-1228P) TaxID=555079 RepID=D9RZC1_THEOJ|nr:GNAT family protein [Thermosediminibacter oceani]ADL06819.1 GCN5-related N-acetyltransferase [Thermosediminibacter oceani DSM 16646]